jgi:hypothetical protein
MILAVAKSSVSYLEGNLIHQEIFPAEEKEPQKR